MSAWIVSKAHIDALVSAAMTSGNPMSWYYDNPSRRGEITYTDTVKASEVGMMLWGENLASINARYPDTIDDPTACPGPCDFDGSASVPAYQFTRTQQMTPVQIIKAIHCYEYQSCEHEGWKTSEAHAFCEALTDKMTNALPGYDDAPWGLDEEDVRPRRVVILIN